MVLDSWAKFIKMNRRVLIRDVNPSLVCFLCKGYYIDATTILECNHAFCRSCIFKHLESNQYCPICDVLVHETEPVLGLKRDKTLQDIVYKLVPGLFEKEMKQRREFYHDRPHYLKPDDLESSGDVSEERKSHVADDSIIVNLSYFQSDIKPWFMRCPVGVSISHLKKLITCKYGFDSSKVEVEILLQSRILDPELTLLDIACLSPYRNKDSLEFSFVMLDMKTMTEAVEKDKDLGAESTGGKASGSVAESVVEKEVQLQITETGIMSVSDVDVFLSDVLESASNVIVAATVVPTSSSVTLTSATPARPTTATVPPTPAALTRGMKRLSVDLRDLSDQKKSKRADEVRPKRPSLEEGETKAKRADDVRPKRSSLAESEVKAKRADDVRPKRPSLAESEVKAKRADEVRPKRSLAESEVKAKRADEVRPKRPSLAESEVKAKRADEVRPKRSLAEIEVKAKRADEVRPKRPSLAESEVNAKRSSVEDREKKGDGVEENGMVDSVDGNSNRPVEDSDKNGKKSLQEREKNVSIPSTTEKTAKRPSVEDQEKKSKTLPANETSRKTRNSSGEGSSNSQKGPSSNIPASSAGLIAASMNHRQGDGRKAQDKSSEGKSDGVATSCSNSKNPIASQSPVRTTPAPSKKPPVPEANSKEASSSSHVPEMDAVASSSYPNDKSDKTAAQKSPKNQTLRSGPDPWRPVITKETLRSKLLNNLDEAKKPAKFFKNRNVPKHSEQSMFLGNPTTGVKRMYSNGMTPMSPPKTPPKKPEPIVRMDPKTMLPMEREGKKSPSMVMTSPFIPRDNKVILPDPKTQPFSHLSSPGFHASLPPSIQLLLNPQQHFRNLNKTREEAASSKHCDTVEPKPSASGSAAAALPSPSSSEPPSHQGKSPTSS